MKYYIGVNHKEKRVKYTTDVDCLSPDINYVTTRELEEDSLHYYTRRFEEIGWKVCIDTKKELYETA